MENYQFGIADLFIKKYDKNWKVHISETKASRTDFNSGQKPNEIDSSDSKLYTAYSWYRMQCLSVIR